MTDTTAPAVGTRVSGSAGMPPKPFTIGYVREHLDSGDAVVEIVRGARGNMGRQAVPPGWLTVEHEVDPAVMAAVKALVGTGVVVTLTLVDGSTATGTVDVDGIDDTVWLVDGPGADGFQPADLRTLTVGTPA